MDIAARLQTLMRERRMSIYGLSKVSGVAWSTIKNILRQETQPGIAALERLCRGLGISMAQFWDTDGSVYQITASKQYLLQRWNALSDEERKVLAQLLNSILCKE